jgi:hypothetical protein
MTKTHDLVVAVVILFGAISVGLGIAALAGVFTPSPAPSYSEMDTRSAARYCVIKDIRIETDAQLRSCFLAWEAAGRPYVGY